MTEYLPTGIDHLDRQLGGGVAAGSVVAFRTPPESQGELLLKRLTTAHETLYLSTTRTDAAIREWLEIDPMDPSDGVDVHYAGADGLQSGGQDEIRDRLSEAAGWTAVHGSETDAEETIDVDAVASAATSFRGRCLVVDPVNPLEYHTESRYKTFLHRLQDHLLAVGAVAFLHVVETQTTPESRWLTLQMADEVWQVDVDIDQSSVEFRLTVTKSRGGKLPDRPIALELGRGVSVDRTRDIA